MFAAWQPGTLLAACKRKAAGVGWYIVGAGLIVMGIFAVVFGGTMASANQKTQSAMWGRTFWTSDNATRYNVTQNKGVGAVAICAGIAVLIAHAVMH
jgi:hypothetical protein